MNKLVSKLFAVIMIIMFISVFRSMIINDPSTSAAFGGLMSALPFAKQISDIVCKVMKFKNTITPISSSSLISDFLKLAVMAAIQPPCVAFLTLIFLPLPQGHYSVQEDYMESPGYKLKEMVITVFSAPLIALAAANITTAISDYLTTKFGPVLSAILGILSVGAFTALSLIPLLFAGVTLGTAIIWRLCVTLLAKMATTMGINVACIWLYLSLAGGISGQTFGIIAALLIWLIIMDIGLKCLQKAIVW